jgi:hypothetical protein
MDWYFLGSCEIRLLSKTEVARVALIARFLRDVTGPWCETDARKAVERIFNPDLGIRMLVASETGNSNSKSENVVRFEKSPFGGIGTERLALILLCPSDYESISTAV